MGPLENFFKVNLNQQGCKGCGLCIQACPKNILEMSETPNQKGHLSAKTKDQEDLPYTKHLRRLWFLLSNVPRSLH